MIKRLILLSGFLFFGLTLAKAQTIFSKNIYQQNHAIINPASMGSMGALYFGFQSSIAGTNAENLPTYASVNAHSAVRDELGVGINFLSENQGPFAITTADAGASYKLNLSEGQHLRFGMTLGFFRQQLDRSGFTTNTFVDQNDPFLTSDFFDETYVRMGVGIIYRINELELSLGSPNFFRGGETFNEEGNIMVRYFYGAENSTIKLIPSVLYQIRPDGANLYDVNLFSYWKDLIGLRLGYRSNESVNLGLSILAGFAEFTYNYNSAMGDLQALNAGNHEMLIALRLQSFSEE